MRGQARSSIKIDRDDGQPYSGRPPPERMAPRTAVDLVALREAQGILGSELSGRVGVFVMEEYDNGHSPLEPPGSI